MQPHPARRELFAILSCLGIAGKLAAAGFPPPKVYHLKDWRKAPGIEAIARALDYLEKHSFAEKPAGKYPIDGDRIYAQLSEKKTTGAGGNFEAHRKFIDIHYLVEGAEMIGSAPLSRLKITKPYDPSGDAELFEVPKDYQRLELSGGDFAVFFPGQPHFPGRDLDGPHSIKKVVVKMLASEMSK